MSIMKNILCSNVLICVFLIILTHSARLYVNQFEEGSEHIQLPNIAFLTIYMGKFDYPYRKLLLESMRWNPKVQFNLINVLEEDKLKDSEEIINLAKSMNVNNFNVTVLSIKQFNDLVNSKLNINIEITNKWFYKLSEYKPTLAFLFPELVDENKYQVWGYGDNDIIWGNFTRFASHFQPSKKIMQTMWWSIHGSATFYSNEDWSKRLFQQDSKFVSLLTTPEYHNLDEDGRRCEHRDMVDDGEHSMTVIQENYAKANNIVIEKGKIPEDNLFIEPADSSRWAGTCRWFRGTVQLLHGSEFFPPGRELLYYHRLSKNIDFPEAIRDNIFDDMITYGYLLPSYTPLLTRYMCKHIGIVNDNTMSNLKTYEPYHPDCLVKWSNYDHIKQNPS